MSVKSVLMEVDRLLSSEDKWTKDQYARDKDGNACSEISDEANCYCLIGAIIAVSHEPGHPIANEAGRATFQHLKNLLFANDIAELATWNDSEERTFQDVKKLISYSIESLH